MPDDLHKEEELFLEALEEYKQKEKPIKDNQDKNTFLPAVIASVL